MKTNKWFFAIVLVSFGWMACDDDDDNVLDKPNLNETDETFLEVAAKSNIAEVEFSELATTKSTDSLVKAFAQQMIDHHTAAQDELEELADDYADVEWSNDLSEAHDEIMDQLTATEGYSFDSLYMSVQVQMHEDATSVFQTATTNTTEARVKAYATKHLPNLESHLAKADSIRTAITPDTTDDGTTDDTTDGTTD